VATVAVPTGQGRIPPHDLDAEQSVLGALVLDPQAITRVLDFLAAEDFYRENHAEIYRAAINLFREGEPIDNVTMASELEKLGVLDRVGGRAQLELLQESVPTAANVEYYARIVKQKAYKRRLISTGADITRLGHDDALDSDDALNQAQSLLYAIADDRTGSNFNALYPLLREAMDRIEAQMASGRGVVGLSSGFFDLDGMTNGFKPSDLVVVAGRPSMGKCVRGDTLVVNPRTGELVTVERAVRERMPLVHGVDGAGRVRATSVSAWVDSGMKPCYLVRTRTGREIVVTHHHPFMTPRGWQPLHDIIRGERIAVPRALPCFGEDRSLGLDQVRLLGYLVAAGRLSQGSPGFSSTDLELLRDFREIVAARHPDLPVRFGRRIHFAARAGDPGIPNPLTGWLRQLGLWGKRAEARRFPSAAWTWDRSRLRELVRTVMSCAGTVSTTGGRPRIELTVASEGLARDMQHAFTRLGIVARLWRKGERAWCLDIAEPASYALYQHEVGWFGERTRRYRELPVRPRRPNAGHPPLAVWSLVREAASDRQMTLNRLAVAVGGWPASEPGQARRGGAVNRLAAYSAVLRSPLLTRLASPDLYWDEVVSIEPAGEHHVYDLSVPDGANFVAADVVVHNTSLVLNVALHAAVESKVPVAIFSLEMSKEQLVERMLCEQARIDAQRMHRGILSEAEQQRLVMALGPLGDAPIWIDDSPTLDELGLLLKARQVKLRENIGMIVVDYLQLMRGRSRRDDYNRVQEVSSISRSLKGLARELKVPVLAVSQLSRAPEQRPDKRPMLSDLRESGCLAAETPVLLDSCEYRPIADLVGRSGVRVLALDPDSWKLVSAPVTAAFSTGRKPVYRLTTGLGRTLRATANHRFLTVEGWKRLDALTRGQSIALSQRLSLEDDPKRYWSREGTGGVAEAVRSLEPATLAGSEAYWDRIVSIEADGVEDVFDVTVDGLHNFVAGDIVVHNSIEQDADLVMFIFRPEYYKADEKPGIAEVIVSKHRNGPTGTIELKFRKELTRFENLERRRPEPTPDD
jgi:replicative DNA helicase